METNEVKKTVSELVWEKPNINMKLLDYIGKGYKFAFGLMARWYVFGTDIHDSINSKL